MFLGDYMLQSLTCAELLTRLDDTHETHFACPWGGYASGIHLYWNAELLFMEEHKLQVKI